MQRTFVTTVLLSIAFVLSASPAWADPGATCRAYGGGTEQTGTLEHEALDESSGLAASRRHPELFWTHNDSGGVARLFLLDREGKHVAEVHLEGRKAVDWEGMAVGPCAPPDTPDHDRTCVYVGDIGNNSEDRESVSIHRFPEPALPDERPASVEVSEDEITTLTVRYDDEPYDSETLLVHPKTAALYLVEKTSATRSGIFRLEEEPPEDNVRVATRVAEMTIEASHRFGRMTTGGDIAPAGDEVSIRTYTGIYTYCFDGDLTDAFDGEPTETSPPLTAQGEALAYGPDGEELWLTSEKRPAPLYRLKRSLEPDD